MLNGLLRQLVSDHMKSGGLPFLLKNVLPSTIFGR